VETDCRSDWQQKGYVAIRVPTYKRRNGAQFQQKGPYQTWDILIVLKGVIIQCKRRRKYMSGSDRIIHVKSSKQWPKTKLIPLLCYRDRGLHYEVVRL